MKRRESRFFHGFYCWGLAVMFAALLLTISQPIRAQEITGGITGTITDPSGAALPNASVTATDVQRGTVWPTQTNSVGVYDFPRLPAGQYTLTVEAKGFATAVRPAVGLEMNQIARVDAALSVGATTQKITVTGAPPLLQMDTMQVGLVTSGNLNENLPLSTRDFLQLTLLTPGVTTVDPTSFETSKRTTFSGGEPYVNGNREENNTILLNGIDNNLTVDNISSYLPNVDAIQEFDMITNNAPAQYGQFSGGVISVTIKSGTDHYHGDVFEFVRNDKFNANSWANNATLGGAIPRPYARWNDFGGTFGGPVIKGKLFFFADYEGHRNDTPASVAAFSVMTAAERQGDFSDILTVSAQNPTAIQLYNPCASMSGPCTEPANPTANRVAFTNNLIPLSMIDPVAQKLFASGVYAEPVNNNLTKNVFYTNHTNLENDQGDLKVDYMLRDQDRFWGSYSEGTQHDAPQNSYPLVGESFDNVPFHGGAIDWTHTFSPTLVMDAKVGVNRTLDTYGSQVQGLGNFAEAIGIAGGNDHGEGLPGLILGGNASQIGVQGNNQIFADTTVEPTVDFIYTRGHHILHIGFQAERHNSNNAYFGTGEYGTMTFGPQYTDGPSVTKPTSIGYGPASFFLGLPSSLAISVNVGMYGQRSWVTSPYLQDDWRITHHLTVNLGLRWTYNQPWYEVGDRQANFGLVNGTEYFAGQTGCTYGNCRALYNNYWRDWQPRIGFAYSPSFLGKSTVVRGAYTISSFLEGTGTNLRLPYNPPYQTQSTAKYTATAAPYTEYFPGSITDQGFSTVANPANPFASAELRVWNPDIQPTMEQQWNFSIEHQFPGQMLLFIGYVGQHGTHLLDPMPYDQKIMPGDPGCPSTNTTPCPPPFLSGNPTLQGEITSIAGTEANGLQAYDGLQVSLRKHMTQGLEFMASYSFQKAMADTEGWEGEGGEAKGNSAWPQDMYNRHNAWGPAYFNEAQVFDYSYVYALPVGSGQRFGSQWNRVAKGVLGGWKLSGIVTMHTGFSLSVTGKNASGTNAMAEMGNCLGPVTYNHQVGQGVTWFNTAAFQTPPANTFGTCGPGTLIGPGERGWDAGIFKGFPITESKRLEFRAEFLNATNTPIFDAPNTNSNAATFGEVTAALRPRNLQFSLKLYF
jgi:hypothetical protein